MDGLLYKAPTAGRFNKNGKKYDHHSNDQFHRYSGVHQMYPNHEVTTYAIHLPTNNLEKYYPLYRLTENFYHPFSEDLTFLTLFGGSALGSKRNLA